MHLTKIDKHIDFYKNYLKKCLPSIAPGVIISDVVTLIALKREVAAEFGRLFRGAKVKL
jgi:hypothetical protein